MGFFLTIERFFIRIRDLFWDYPGILFLNENSVARGLRTIYLRARPFSHAFISFLIFVLISGAVFADVATILRINKTTFIEGVIVGQDEEGELQKVLSINPLIITNIQVKRDIAELVYEPLFRVNQQNAIELVLVDNYADLGEGKTYRFKLKENVKWHDGEDFTSDDVVATFKLLQSLEYGNQTSSVYSKAAEKVNVEKIDDYRLEFSLKDQDSVIPNFFEMISFKILPQHLIENLNSTNILYPDEKINNSPVGTGPFKVGPLNLERIVLDRNNEYYGGRANFHKLIFRLYKEHTQAVNDLKTGQIHALIGVSSDDIQELGTVPNLSIQKSNVIYNQYWGIYFNLSEQNESAVKQEKVRQAISSAINKELLIEALVGSAVKATGPIPKTSFAFKESEKYIYSVSSAQTLLDEAGWTMSEGQDFRTNKDGEVLELNFVYVENVDRDKVMTLVKRDLEEVGIKMNPIAKTIAEINNDHVLPAIFDMLLYGVSTFIDPDRYELFHSSQIGYPNLNISSYKSAEETTRIQKGKTERIPEVDYLLERGRSFLDEEARRTEYVKFQGIVMTELPVVYLYHPVYTYIINRRVKAVGLKNLVTLEDRFNRVTKWHMEV